jgi:TubC N-terminal docking domain
MTAVEVLHTLRARDIRLTADGNQLRYDAPESAITEAVLTLLRQHKTALLALLQQGHTSISEAMAQEAEAPSTAPALAASAAVPPSHIQGQKPPTAAWRCPCCKGTRRWRSVYGTVVCGTCHPPADVALVAGWEDA